MDPDENLRQQRAIRETILNNKEDYIDPGDALELIELMAALDEWISKGGALPKAWLQAGCGHYCGDCTMVDLKEELEDE